MIYKNKLTNKTLNLIKSLKRISNNNENIFVVEGLKCCYELLKSDYNILFAVVNKKNKDDEFIKKLVRSFYYKGIEVFEVSNSIFLTLTSTVTPQGIIAIVEKKEDVFSFTESFVILDEVSDPGNVGTIIRTAEWFGINQIILLGNCANKYSTKVVRSTMGAFFRTKIKMIKYSQLNDLIKNYKNIRIFGAFLDAQTLLTSIHLNKDEIFGIVVGNEARGISKETEKIITNKFKIQGFGNSESLNVGIALGISLFYLCK